MSVSYHLLFKNKIVFALVSLCFFLGIGVFLYFIQKGDGDTIFIDTHEVFVDVMRTNSEHARGLSGRKKLCKNCGMLFIFDVPQERTFWMKDMLFDIDIVWIRDDRIVHISQGIDHSGGIDTIVQSHKPVDMVVELPAGYISKHHIDIGQTISYKKYVVE